VRIEHELRTGATDAQAWEGLAGGTWVGPVRVRAGDAEYAGMVRLVDVDDDGRRAGAHALTGLVRSLPCYLAFCLVVAFAAPSAGPAAVALGLLACVATARVTWRRVPVARPRLTRVSP
jgi:hypothetical protein